MKSGYQRPASVHNDALSSIIDEIVKLINPEKIFLTGASYEHHLTENIFIKNPLKQLICSRYDLLIIADNQEKISDQEKELLLYTKFRYHPGLHFRLMDIHAFNKSVREGKELENFILLNAMICYDNGVISLEDPIIGYEL